MYRSLNPDKTVETIETLHSRIEERFPASGLSKVCKELCIAAADSKARVAAIAKPNYILRVFVGVIIFLIILVLVYSISLMDLKIRSLEAAVLIPIIEAALNDLLLIGAALFFLVTIEGRIKRTRTLKVLHELRTIAHVIDMHQLTKDPGRLGKNVLLTQSSPKYEMTAYELMRYLDYCSEMLSLTGKVAALYAQNLRDSIVLSAVNEIENLTTGLSRKIWQKIMILNKICE